MNAEIQAAVQKALISDLYGDTVTIDPTTLEQLIALEIPQTISNHLTDVALEISCLARMTGLSHLLAQLITYPPTRNRTDHVSLFGIV